MFDSRKSDDQARSPDDSWINRDVLELPHHGVWVVDADDRTLFANETLRRLIGTHDMEGRVATSFFPPGERPRVDEQSTRRTFGVADEYETRLRTADGFEVPVLVSASPRFDDGGRYRGTVAVIRDLRLDKQVEAAVAERMGHNFVRGHEQQLGRYLTTGLAHALNSTLQAVLGHGDALARASELPGDLQASVARIQGAARTCSRLVGNLLSLGRLGDEEPAGVDVVALVDEALASRQPYLPANNVIVRRRYDETCGTVWADPARVRRALTHLVNNACELALVGGGGTLEVTTRCDDDRVHLALHLRSHRFPEDLVGLTPADIRPDLQPLALSHLVAVAIVSDLGGSVRVRNEEHGGVVEVWLPAEEAAAHRPVRPVRPAPTVVPGADRAHERQERARLLVVDDDPDILEINTGALEGLGDISTATTADRALALLESEHFDVIVSDLRMPGALDGIGLFRWLRRARPDLVDRVVFTTADTTSPQAQDFLESSGRPFIKKPYGMRDFRRLVEEALR
ncbi:MAG: response regulator [Myxococcota bacterium]